MIELLQYEHFRKELVNSQCAKFIDDQQLLTWQHYQRKRNALLQVGKLLNKNRIMQVLKGVHYSVTQLIFYFFL